jgi:hypothetical protein
LPEPKEKVEIYPETNYGYFLSPITIYPDIIENEHDNKEVITNISLPG